MPRALSRVKKRQKLDNANHISTSQPCRASTVNMAAKETFVIKPEAVTPPVDWSQHPLLLKNYDKRA